jgi:tetratricopeptide (TPR) repeat protein
MEAAKEHFEKANQLQPNTILFLFGEASVLHYMGQTEQAKKLLEHAIGLPLREPDDAQRKLRCEHLLELIRNQQ